MAQSTEELIESLVADASPVRRLRPPVTRACVWLAAVAVVGGLLVLLFADFDVFRQRADSRLILELAATLATGIAAVIAAFQLSLPDRSAYWLFLPLPALAAWLAVSGYGCYRHWLDYGPSGWQIGESANCFAFIVGAGMPLGASLLVLLRRAAPLAPLPTAAAGALAAAAIAAFILQFFHPFDITFIDLGVHGAAVMIVVALGALVGRFAPIG